MSTLRALRHHLGGVWLAGLFLSGPLYAQVQQFQARWEMSRWQVEASAKRCSMTQQIPRWGRASFEQESGHRLQFSLYADQPPASERAARVHSQAPPWKHQVPERSLGEFRLKQGKNPLRVPREQALRMYYELEQGMTPVIEFADWGDGQDRVQVALIPVRFREALPAFLACTANLLYLDFEPISEQTVFFATNSDRLTRAARRVLENIAREYRKHRNLRVVLGGHADERGSAEYNMKLSRLRARVVARYLQSRGVSANVIESRFFGETRPQDPASGKEAWARNRRVTLWLAEK